MAPRLFWFLILMPCGCSGTRWAMDDPDYATKYSRDSKNVLKQVKQASDARHLRRKGGGYASLNGRDDPFALGGEIGAFYYPDPYVEGRAGLAGLIYEGDTPVSGGVLAGARLQTPTRLAPFVGIAGYLGMTPDTWLSHDGIDNDLDSQIDEADEATTDFAAALIPEVGCHYWLTPDWRVSASTGYYMMSDGPANDFWSINISLAFLKDLGKATSRRTLARQARERGWHLGDGDAPVIDTNSDYYAPSEPLRPATSQSIDHGM